MDGAEKARMLGNGIAEAIYDGALVALVAVVAALWLLFATWRWRWAVKPRVVEADPPYR